MLPIPNWSVAQYCVVQIYFKCVVKWSSNFTSSICCALVIQQMHNTRTRGLWASFSCLCIHTFMYYADLNVLFSLKPPMPAQHWWQPQSSTVYCLRSKLPFTYTNFYSFLSQCERKLFDHIHCNVVLRRYTIYCKSVSCLHCLWSYDLMTG